MSSIGRRAFARILLLASALVVLGACDKTPPTAAAPAPPQRTLTIDPNAYYVIRNVASYKVMDVSNAGCCNGAWVHQWSYEGLANQQWRITDVGGGYYKIVARHSGKALDVEGGSTSDWARIHQWDYQGLANQQWSITFGANYAFGTAYFLTARHSGKVAGLTAGDVNSNGLGIRQFSNGGWQASIQHWYLEQVQ